VSEQLRTLIVDDHIDPAQIAVLVANEQVRSSLVQREFIGDWKVVNAEEKPRNSVVCETVRRFKGLERAVVVVVEPEALLDSPETLYVALTRARVLLCLLGSNGRLQQLESLLIR
jgi:DNA helicase IV